MPIIQERNLNLKQNKISLWWKRWFLSSNAKDIGTLCLIFALFWGLLGTAFSVLIRLQLSVPGVQYIVDNQLYNSIMTAHAILMILFFVMPLLPEYIYNSPPKPHAFCTTSLLSLDPITTAITHSAGVCSVMTPLAISIGVFIVGMSIKFGAGLLDDLNYTQLLDVIRVLLDLLSKGDNINEILGWNISAELLQQLMVTDLSFIQAKACMIQVLELALNKDISSLVLTAEEAIDIANKYLSDEEPIVSYSQEHGIRLGHLRALGRAMSEIPASDASSLIDSINTFRR